MPLITYIPYNPSQSSIELIDQSNQILEEFASQGYQLTLRQLYYQLVASDLIPNTMKSYNRLKSVVSRAREGGLMDWGHIVDRTRIVREFPHWEGSENFMREVVPQYRHDLWLGQRRRVMVFVEKEALEQVVGRACEPWDVPYLANKGYLSQSAAWNVGRNMILHHESGCRRWLILHLGDHDPSGIDMTRDIRERLRLFASRTQDHHEAMTITVRRIALNMRQIEEHEPPPNPAKQQDPRFDDYAGLYGRESWELDALRPAVIDELIQSSIQGAIQNSDLFASRLELQDRIRAEMLERYTDQEPGVE